MRDKEFLRKIVDYASAEMKRVPGMLESDANELLCNVALWLHMYAEHCDELDRPCPAVPSPSKFNFFKRKRRSLCKQTPPRR